MTIKKSDFTKSSDKVGLANKKQQIENTKKLIAGINKARELAHSLAHGIPMKKRKKQKKNKITKKE